MPQHVRGDGLAAQGRAALGGSCGVVGEAMLDRVAAERGAATGREQRGVWAGVLLVEPVLQGGGGAAGERGDPVLAAFAMAGDVRAGAEVQVVAGEPNQLGDP